MLTLSRTQTLALLDAGAHLELDDGAPVARDAIQNYEPRRIVSFTLAENPTGEGFVIVETHVR